MKEWSSEKLTLKEVFKQINVRIGVEVMLHTNLSKNMATQNQV